MAFLSEAAVEQALLDQLRALDYSIEREEDIGPDGHRPERESHDEVVLKKRFEDAVARIAAAQGSAEVAEFPRALAVFFSDNGVVAEGVSQSGQDVTRVVARNMCEGATSACRMAAFAGAEVVPVDVGMARGIEDAHMVRANVRRGSGNIAHGSAMSRDGAVRAIEVGIAVACGLARAGVRLLAAGEMGIGNTTTSAAVAAVLIRADARSLVGRGAGLSDASLARKRDVVERAIDANSPDSADPIDVLSKVGGFDIAAMCGFYLGAAASKAPALLDGVISCTAALCAVRPVRAIRMTPAGPAVRRGASTARPSATATPDAPSIWTPSAACWPTIWSACPRTWSRTGI